VVVHLFSDECGTGHEPESLVEILEDIFLGDRVAAHGLAPVFQSPKRCLARFPCKFGHRVPPLSYISSSLTGLSGQSMDATHEAGHDGGRMNWTDAQAPTLDDIEAMAVEAFAFCSRFSLFTGDVVSWCRTFRTLKSLRT
jgi:hypothetical protein